MDRRKQFIEWKKRIASLIGIAVAIGAAGCGANRPAEDAGAAAGLLRKAAEQAEGADRFSLHMKLEQQLISPAGDESYSLTSDGTVELKPLAVEQSIESVVDGEASRLRTILTGEGYFMEDQTFGEGWSRLSGTEHESVRETLSVYQTDPAGQLRRMIDYGAGGFTIAEKDGKQELTFDGKGHAAAARALMNDLLDSTLNGTQMEQRVKDSVQIDKLHYKIVLDSETDFLEEIRTAANFTIAWEPEERVKVEQTFTLQYERWNGTSPITVPEEALNAPEIEMPSPEEVQEWEELERQLQEAIDAGEETAE